MKGCITALVTLAVLTCAIAAGAMAGNGAVATVRVTIHGHPEGNPAIPGKVYYAPDKVKAGTLVTFKITNTDIRGHDFEINGVISRIIGAKGGQGLLRVRFKKPGNYFGSCIDDNHSGIGGLFVVS